MDQFLIILAIIGALLIGVMSPGPSFIVVARTSLSVSRRAGLGVSVGMGLASTLFGFLALAGLHVILEQVAWLYLGLKMVGGSYLIYLAWKTFKGAGEPLVLPDQGNVALPENRAPLWRMVLMGFLTQISNPKTAVVFASVFATFLTFEPTAGFYMVLIPLIFLSETGWYMLVTLALSANRPRKVYAGAKSWIDRIASGVLGMLGIKLVGDAV